MKKILSLLIAAALFVGCNPPNSETSEEASTTKIPVHAWIGGPGDKTDEELKAQFDDLKSKGIDALMYNGGQDAAVYARVGKIAKASGLGFHTWIPTMVQSPKEGIDSSWYAVNGLGESALDKPAYVDYYKFLCPNQPGTLEFLRNMYVEVGKVPEVDGIHLDYIRFPDVILARGLWDKYGLVMDKEYPQFDYCYCDLCTSGFQEKTGIDIKASGRSFSGPRVEAISIRLNHQYCKSVG